MFSIRVETLSSGTKHHEVPVTMTMGGEHEFDEHKVTGTLCISIHSCSAYLIVNYSSSGSGCASASLLSIVLTVVMGRHAVRFCF